MADLSQYDDIFQAAGNEWNVDPTLLKAMASQESQGDPRAVSKKGAVGLMQITPDTAKGLGVTDLNDPVQSIYGGAKYMNEALDAEGTPEKALLYYHGGPNWRDKYGPESRAYVPAVTAHYVALKPQQTDQQPQAAPAASTPAPAPSPASQSGPLILGDSLASKGGLGGTGVVGASPKAVLDSINGMPADQVQGRDVVLSGGASNNPGQASLVYDQVQQLKAKGAHSVTVVGVGDRPDFQGVNDQLALVSGRSGANFVPLDTTQLGPDRVHPTAQGYKTLLAAVTPKTATDASAAPASAPAAPQGQGKAMASDDLPSWLPPAPSAGGGASASAPAAMTGAASDGLPSWLPPAPQSSAPEQQEVPRTAQDVGTSSEQTAPAWMSQGPPGQTADEQVRNALAPAPDTVYGNVLPLAMDTKTGQMRAAMPNMLRAPLLGMTGGVGNAITIDQDTGKLGLTPEAASTAAFAATPLRFGASPGVAPGLIDTTRAPDLPPNLLSPDLAARQAVRSATAPALPPVPDGMVRLYHGGSDSPATGGARWVTTDPQYAKGYSPTTGQVWYADVPRNDPAVAAATDTVNVQPGQPPRVVAFNAPESIAKQMQPVPGSAQTGPSTPTPGRYREPDTAPPAASAPQAASAPSTGAVPKTSAEAKQIASAYYDIADKSGGTLTPQFTNKFVDSVEAAAPQTEAGQAVAGDSAVTTLVKRLQTLRDKPLSLQGAQEVDEGLSNLISKEYGVNGLSKDGQQLLDVQSALRDQIEKAQPGDIQGGAEGFDALVQGRKAWSQARKMDDLERIQERADNTDNPATSIKSQVRTLLDNRKRSRGYDDDEKAALADAASRGVLGGALHVFGSRLIPIAAGAAGAASGPFSAIGSAIGAHVATAGMRRLAASLQANRLNRALGTVAGSVPPNPLQAPPP